MRLVSDTSPDRIEFRRNVTKDTFVSSLTDDGIFNGDDGAIQNTYKVTNIGPFSLPIAHLQLSWPSFTADDHLPLLYLYDISCQPAGKCACDSRDVCENVNPWKLPYENYTTTTSIYSAAQCEIGAGVGLNNLSALSLIHI